MAIGLVSEEIFPKTFIFSHNRAVLKFSIFDLF